MLSNEELNERGAANMRKIIINIDKFTEFRIKKGYTISSLSKLVKISKSGLRKIELSENSPSPTTAKSIADALEVPFDELFKIV